MGNLFDDEPEEVKKPKPVVNPFEATTADASKRPTLPKGLFDVQGDTDVKDPFAESPRNSSETKPGNASERKAQFENRGDQDTANKSIPDSGTVASKVASTSPPKK